MRFTKVAVSVVCLVFGLSFQAVCQSAPEAGSSAPAPVPTAGRQAGTEVKPAEPAVSPAPAVSGLSPGAGGAAVISTGDLLDVGVYGVPELSQKVRVNGSGDVYLPLVNYVHVEGLTVEQAQGKLEKELLEGGFLRNPHVSIFVSEYASGVYIMGEVGKPGMYPVVASRRLFDVIASAGGLTNTAGNVVTITHRAKPQEPETVLLSNDPKSTEGNVQVTQGDTIVVSKAGVVYVVGEVVSPAGFIMERNQTMTVLKVIAMAHGTTHNASLDGIKLIRKSPEGLKEVPVPLRKILQAKVSDMEVQADDIVFVPTSGSKNAARRAADTALGLVSGITLVRATRY